METITRSERNHHALVAFQAAELARITPLDRRLAMIGATVMFLGLAWLTFARNPMAAGFSIVMASWFVIILLLWRRRDHEALIRSRMSPAFDADNLNAQVRCLASAVQLLRNGHPEADQLIRASLRPLIDRGKGLNTPPSLIDPAQCPDPISTIETITAQLGLMANARTAFNESVSTLAKDIEYLLALMEIR